MSSQGIPAVLLLLGILGIHGCIGWGFAPAAAGTVRKSLLLVPQIAPSILSSDMMSGLGGENENGVRG